MILKENELGKYGVRIESITRKELLQNKIDDAELLVVKPMLGEDPFNRLVEISETEDPLIAGGKFVREDKSFTYIGGIKKAIANVTFAMLLLDRVIATPFGSVVKTSDESTPEYNPYDAAMDAYTIGSAYIREVAKEMKVKVGKPQYQAFM